MRYRDARRNSPRERRGPARHSHAITGEYRAFRPYVHAARLRARTRAAQPRSMLRRWRRALEEVAQLQDGRLHRKLSPNQ